MSFDPYQTLGVGRDASDTEIKAAFNKRAKKTHPDKGGSADEFIATRRAMTILSDAGRRAKFDRDGTIDDVAPDNSEQVAIQLIVQVFTTAVSQFVEGKGKDPKYFDMVQMARHHIQTALTGFEQRLAVAERAKEVLADQAKRMKYRRRKSSPVLKLALAAQAKMFDEQKRVNEPLLRQHRRALEILDDYEFDFETMQQVAGQFFFTVSG